MKKREFYTGIKKKTCEHRIDFGDGRGEVLVNVIGEALYDKNSGRETFYKGPDGRDFSFIEDPYGFKRITKTIPDAKIDFARIYTAEPSDIVQVNGYNFQIVDKNKLKAIDCRGEVPFSLKSEITEIIGVYPQSNNGNYAIRIFYPPNGNNRYQLAITVKS